MEGRSRKLECERVEFGYVRRDTSQQGSPSGILEGSTERAEEDYSEGVGNGTSPSEHVERIWKTFPCTHCNRYGQTRKESHIKDNAR